MDMMTIKERLANGVTVEELMKEAQAEIIAAAREVEAEKDAASDIKEARENVVDAIFDYLVALGFCDEEDISDELIDLVEEALEESEAEMKEYAPIVRAMAKVKNPKTNKAANPVTMKVTKLSPDEVLKRFTENL